MQKVVLTVPCAENIKKDWEKRFSGFYKFSYPDSNEIENELQTADIAIGEPALNIVKSASKNNLRWIQTTSAGVDIYTGNGDFPQNVTLTNAKIYGKIISEYVLATILTCYRRLSEYRENQKKSLWQSVGAERTLQNKTVLVLGTGDIGKEIARKLKAFDAKVIGLRRSETSVLENFDEVYTLAELKNLLPKADIVIGCMPKTNETVGLLDAEHLNLMKDNAMLVNVGRGTLIVTDDLIDCLNRCKFSNVILDVTEREPLPETSELWDFERVLITPHISGKGLGYAPETEEAIWNLCTENLKNYKEGKSLKNIIDLKRGY